MRRLAPLLLLVLLLPMAGAHHPGTNVPPALGLGPLQPHAVHRNVDVGNQFADWSEQYPDFVKREDLGRSSSGQNLHGIVITYEKMTGNLYGEKRKAVVYLDGGHHGNEYLATDIILYYLGSLLEAAADRNGTVLSFLADVEIHAAPLVNPDGNALDTRKNGRLVDLNRNYPFQWGGPGSGDSIVDQTYKGEAALSEPESAANAAYGRKILPDLWITMHTGVAEFYWPWGWVDKPSPDDAFFRSLEGPFENATGGRIDAKQGSKLYLAAGATDDWAYAELGVPAFTFEVHEDQFFPAYGEPIPDLLQAQIDGLDLMVKNVRNMGGRVSLYGSSGCGSPGISLFNRGWGAAHNVTVDLGNGSRLDVGELAPGEEQRFNDTMAQGGAFVQWSPLKIPSSRTTRADGVLMIADCFGPNQLPAVEAFMSVLTVGLVVYATRRRR